MTPADLIKYYIESTRRWVREALASRRAGDSYHYALYLGFARQSGESLRIIR